MLELSEAIEAPASRRQLWLTRFNQTSQLLAQSSQTACWISDGTPPFAGRELHLPFVFDRALAVPNTNLMLCSLAHGVNLQLIDITRTDVLCGFTGGVQKVEAMNLSNDLSLLSAGLANGDLVCWRFPETPDDGDYRSAVSEHAANSRAVSMNPGNLVDSPSVPTIYEAIRWHLFECPVTSVVAAADRILVSSSDGGLVSLPRWLPDSDRQSLIRSADNTATQLRSLAWNPDGRALVVGLKTGVVHINRFKDPPTVFPKVEIHQNGIAALAATVHTNAFDTDADQIAVLSSHTGSAETVVVSPNGRILATSHSGEGLAVHRIDSEMILGQWAPPEDDNPEWLIPEIKFSNDSQHIAWTGTDSQLHVGPISLKSAEMLNIDLKGNGQYLAWSPDDRFVFVGGRFDDVLEVEVSSGSQRSLMTHAAHPTAMTFNPRRSRLITGHKDGTLRFTDPETCAVTQVLQFHDVNIQAIALSGDRRIGIGADIGANLALWFAETGERIGTLESMSERPLEFFPVRPTVIFTENDTAFHIVYATYDNRLATKSWRFK